MGNPSEKIWRKAQKTILATLICCLGAYALIIEPGRIVVNHLEVDQPGLNLALAGKIAVHLSDLHIGKIGRQEQKVLGMVNELNADFIFLTGDLIGWQEDPEEALGFLSQLKARVGVWAVMGDYDYSRSRRSCVFCHERGSAKPTTRHSVRFLKDSWEQLDYPGGKVWIGGIDLDGWDAAFSNGRVAQFPQDRPGIVLSHSPLQFDQADENQEQLMLAGDTHGGQVPLPGWLWGLLGYEKNVRYNEGVFERGRNKMVVTRGIGTSHLPVRFLRPPEIVVLHF